MSTKTPKYQIMGSLVNEYTDREKAELAGLILSTFSDLSKEIDCEGEMAALISRSPMDFPYGVVERVDTIGERAFNKAVFNDTDIVIPDNVGVIDQFAFSQSNITSVIIPDNCEIRDYAFHYCENLEKVEIPDSVTSLGWFLFDASPKAVVYCSIKSYAAQYCVEQNIPAVYTDNFVSLSVNTLPNVTTYPMGSSLDTTGLSLTVMLDDGSEVEVTAGYTIGDYSFSTGGTKTITVSVGAASTEFEVFVDETLPAWPESEHPYANNTDTTWTYTYPEEAGMLRVTFSSKCFLIPPNDRVYITDASGATNEYIAALLVGDKYIQGNTFTIRLVSDGEGTGYGFSIDKIEKMW